MFREYYVPKTTQDCLEAASAFGDGAYYLAGGTDLVVKMRSGALSPEAVIDLSHVDGLDKITQTDKETLIGAMHRLTPLSRLATVKGVEVICRAAGHVSSIQVRNMATIGGNTCNASPSADTVPALIVMDAQAVVAGPKGTRRIPLAEFFAGPGRTSMEKGELLTAFAIPREDDITEADYQKFSIRGDSDIAIIGAATRVSVDADGTITKARVALGAVAATPIRAHKAEEILTGQKLSAELVAEAAKAAAEEARPISDQRAAREYRIKMVRVHIAVALKNCMNRIAGSVRA
jgi:CO/xanthine dehydrogenase FAD-binding subunit